MKMWRTKTGSLDVECVEVKMWFQYHNSFEEAKEFLLEREKDLLTKHKRLLTEHRENLEKLQEMPETANWNLGSFIVPKIYD